jgi:hypothetical protein
MAQEQEQLVAAHSSSALSAEGLRSVCENSALVPKGRLNLAHDDSPIRANLFCRQVFASPTHHKNVILRGCDFFDFAQKRLLSMDRAGRRWKRRPRRPNNRPVP